MFFIVEERTGFPLMRIRYFIPSQIKGKHFPSCTQGYCVCVCVSFVFLFLIHEVAYFCRANHYLANLLLEAIQVTNFFIITFSNFANGLSANILYLVPWRWSKCISPIIQGKQNTHIHQTKLHSLPKSSEFHLFGEKLLYLDRCP